MRTSINVAAVVTAFYFIASLVFSIFKGYGLLSMILKSIRVSGVAFGVTFIGVFAATMAFKSSMGLSIRDSKGKDMKNTQLNEDYMKESSAEEMKEKMGL